MGERICMSYDLYFWRQTKDFETSPKNILKALSQDQPVEGIFTYPREQVLRALKKTFPDVDDKDLIWEGAGSYFQISFGYADEKQIHLIAASCGYKLLDSPEVLNRLID